MDYAVILKAAFQTFALSIGVILLIFTIAGTAMKVPRRSFNRVFLLSSIASFAAVYLLLHYKIRVSPAPESPIFLVGCVGGWLSATTFAITQMKRYLTACLK